MNNMIGMTMTTVDVTSLPQKEEFEKTNSLSRIQKIRIKLYFYQILFRIFRQIRFDDY